MRTSYFISFLLDDLSYVRRTFRPTDAGSHWMLIAHYLRFLHLTAELRGGARVEEQEMEIID